MGKRQFAGFSNPAPRTCVAANVTPAVADVNRNGAVDRALLRLARSHSALLAVRRLVRLLGKPPLSLTYLPSFAIVYVSVVLQLPA
jgi:hypothetical protein